MNFTITYDPCSNMYNVYEIQIMMDSDNTLKEFKKLITTKHKLRDAHNAIGSMLDYQEVVVSTIKVVNE